MCANQAFSEKQRSTAFGALLLAQIVLLLVPPILDYLKWEWITTLCITGVILISAIIVSTTRQHVVIGLILALASLTAFWIEDQLNQTGASVVANGLGALFFTYMGARLAARVASRDSIDLDAILAAITGYIFIGLIGSFVVETVEILSPGSFNLPEGSDGYVYAYFSFVTITTLGYGDIAPISPLARAVSTLLAIGGQIYITVILAMIVGRYIAGGKT